MSRIPEKNAHFAVQIVSLHHQASLFVKRLNNGDLL